LITWVNLFSARSNSVALNRGFRVPLYAIAVEREITCGEWILARLAITAMMAMTIAIMCSESTEVEHCGEVDRRTIQLQHRRYGDGIQRFPVGLWFVPGSMGNVCDRLGPRRTLTAAMLRFAVGAGVMGLAFEWQRSRESAFGWLSTGPLSHRRGGSCDLVACDAGDCLIDFVSRTRLRQWPSTWRYGSP